MAHSQKSFSTTPPSQRRYPGQIIVRHLAHFFRQIAATFWFVPALCILAGLLASQVMLDIDRTIDINGRIPILGWVADVGADGARSMLSAIGTAMLGVAATAFSITISVIATASSNYGPRLVRNFMSDRGNQVVLGMLSTTFIYVLMVLRTIRSEQGERELFVPHLSVTLAILLALVDVGMLVWFIHHIADSIQVNTIAQDVRVRWLASIKRWFRPSRNDNYGDYADYPYPINAAQLQKAAETQRVVVSDTPTHAMYPEQQGSITPALMTLNKVGYIIEIDLDALADFAASHELRLVLLKRVGDHVVEDEPVMQLWPSEKHDDIQQELRRQFSVDDSRTTYQDLQFAQQQLVELAVRALSPGTNDPYTAINAVNELGAGICVAVSRPHPGDVIIRNEQPRLWYLPVTQAEILTMPFDHIRPFAPQSIIVMKALIDLARRAQAASIYPELAELAEQKIQELRAEVEQAGVNPCDLQAVDDYIEQTDTKTRLAWVNTDE